MTGYFTQPDVLQVHPCCSLRQDLLPFKAKSYSIVWMDHDLLIHSSLRGHVVCFHIFTLVDAIAMNTGVQTSARIPAGYLPFCSTEAASPCIPTAAHRAPGSARPRQPLFSVGQQPPARGEAASPVTELFP